MVLVTSLSEVIKDALRLPNLSHIGVDGWASAMMDLDCAVDQIKGMEGVSKLIEPMGRRFDELVDHILEEAFHHEELALERLSSANPLY